MGLHRTATKSGIYAAFSYAALALLSFPICVMFLPVIASAEEAVEGAEASFIDVPDLPESVPPLPGPMESGVRLVVDSTNVASFHEVLLAPIVAWLKSGKMSLEVVSRLNFAWSLSPDWNRATENSTGEFDLSHDNSIFLDGKPLSVSGFPFGRRDRIGEVEDPNEKAFHILWNMAFSMLPTQDALYGVELQWIGKRKLIRKASGAFFRVVNRRLSFSQLDSEPQSGEPEQPQPDASAPVEMPEADADSALASLSPQGDVVFWREVLKLFSPPGVYGYAAVSQRYFGSKEDDFWVYSPVLGRSRQVLASNRGDGLIGGLLTFDDIFLWGSKIQAVEAKVVEEKTMLLPFPSSSTHRLNLEQVIVKLPEAKKYEEEEGEEEAPAAPPDSDETEKTASPIEVTEMVLTARGYRRRADQAAAMVLWNHESKRFRSAEAWVPTSVVFVPRKVWIVEVSPRDPYYLTGRQVMIIDQESFLPFYKVVYNRSGEYDRLLMAGWVLAVSESGSTRLPIPGFVLGVSSGSEPSMAISVKYARTFMGKKTPAAAELYDLLSIESHEKAAKAQEAPVEHVAEE